MIKRPCRPTPLVMGLVAALAALPMLPACGDDDPSGPCDCPPEVSGNIDATGGTLAAADDSWMLTIPAGALSGTTRITVREIDPVALAYGTSLRSFEFEPADLSFAIDATFAVDLPVNVALRGSRALRADLPIVAVTSGELGQLPQVSEVLDYVATVPHVTGEPVRVAVNVRGLGAAGAYMVLLDGRRPAEGQTPVDFGTKSTESYLDAIVDLLLGSTYEVMVTVSVPSFFTPSDPVTPTFLPGLTELISATLNPGESIPVIGSGIDAESRDFRNFSITASVPGTLENGTTARFGWGIRSSFSVDITDYWASQDPLVFDVVVEESYPAIDIPVVLSQSPTGYAPGIYDVGAGVERVAFLEEFGQWRYQASMAWAVGNGGRILNRTFNALTPDLQSSPLRGFYVVGSNDGAQDGVPAGLTAMAWGSNYLGFTSWDYGFNEFTTTQIVPTAGNITDSAPYDDDPLSDGLYYVDNTRSLVGLVEYNGFGFSGVATVESFPGATGKAIGAFVRRDGDALIAVDGAPGQLYRNSLMPAASMSTLIGALGDEPRDIEAIDEFAVVSLFGSGALQPLIWGLDGQVTILDPVPVGDGPIAFDMKKLDSGNYLTVSAGYNDDSVWMTEFTPAGSVVSNESMALPAELDAPSHAAFVPGSQGLILVNGNATGKVGIMVNFAFR